MFKFLYSSGLLRIIYKCAEYINIVYKCAEASCGNAPGIGFLFASCYGTVEHRDNVIAQQLQLAGLYYGFTHNYTSALSTNA